ncbi:MAG: hypothetical protein P4L10_17585 [Acidobacteriaceae bacterium]|nr:hypothetical protein [Acidobacteriaceae bacterium]
MKQSRATLTQDRRIPQILSKTKGWTRPTKKPIKDENSELAQRMELLALEEQGMRARSILDSLNALCDAKGSDMESGYSRARPAGEKERKPAVSEGIKEIQKKNREIKSILETMKGEQGMLQALELENVFKKNSAA